MSSQTMPSEIEVRSNRVEDAEYARLRTDILLLGRILGDTVRYKEGAVATTTTYNGYVFTATNAEELLIPELPDGFNGITNREHLRCKNFRFAVSVFGASDART